MTPSETVNLVAIITQVWPSMKVDSHTPDAWSLVLDDVPFPDAMIAVKHLAKARGGYIQPYDIRRQIAAANGLLAPSEAEGLQDAAYVAGQRGEGASKLHPVVYRAYRAMGGPTAFDAPPSVIRPQWHRVWDDVVRAHEEELLGGNLGTELEKARRLELTA